jgi:hypothetical protein
MYLPDRNLTNTLQQTGIITPTRGNHTPMTRTPNNSLQVTPRFQLDEQALDNQEEEESEEKEELEEKSSILNNTRSDSQAQTQTQTQTPQIKVSSNDSSQDLNSEESLLMDPLKVGIPVTRSLNPDSCSPTTTTTTTTTTSSMNQEFVEGIDPNSTTTSKTTPSIGTNNTNNNNHQNNHQNKVSMLKQADSRDCRDMMNTSTDFQESKIKNPLLGFCSTFDDSIKQSLQFKERNGFDILKLITRILNNHNVYLKLLYLRMGVPYRLIYTLELSWSVPMFPLMDSSSSNPKSSMPLQQLTRLCTSHDTKAQDELVLRTHENCLVVLDFEDLKQVSIPSKITFSQFQHLIYRQNTGLVPLFIPYTNRKMKEALLFELGIYSNTLFTD